MGAWRGETVVARKGVTVGAWRGCNGGGLEGGVTVGARRGCNGGGGRLGGGTTDGGGGGAWRGVYRWGLGGGRNSMLAGVNVTATSALGQKRIPGSCHGLQFQ